jgi:syntaxin-binding protein 1
MSTDMDAIYLLSPQPHIVDCLMADFERRRYRKTFLVWTALLEPQMRRRIDSSQSAQKQLGGFETLSIDYFPRESHLVTFRDSWSFPMLYHPACNNLVAQHMQSLAQKVNPHLSNARMFTSKLISLDYWNMCLIGRVPQDPVLRA